MEERATCQTVDVHRDEEVEEVENEKGVERERAMLVLRWMVLKRTRNKPGMKLGGRNCILFLKQQRADCEKWNNVRKVNSTKAVHRWCAF